MDGFIEFFADVVERNPDRRTDIVSGFRQAF